MDSSLQGKRIKLIYTDDPYTSLKPDAMGTIFGVDDAGQIMIKWDNGSTLSMIPRIDRYQIFD
jgi:hypothetical protein